MILIFFFHTLIFYTDRALVNWYIVFGIVNEVILQQCFLFSYHDLNWFLYIWKYLILKGSWSKFHQKKKSFINCTLGFYPRGKHFPSFDIKIVRKTSKILKENVHNMYRNFAKKEAVFIYFFSNWIIRIFQLLMWK